MPLTTQRSISAIHPTITTPQNKNTAFPPTTIQSTVNQFLLLQNFHEWITRHLDRKRNHDNQTNKKQIIEIIFQIIIIISL